MKIAFNATPLISPLTGIGQYTYHLAKGLQATQGLDLDYFYASGWSKEIRNKPLDHIVKFKSLFKKIVPKSYFVSRYLQQSNFTRGIKSKPFTLYHEPNFLTFKFKGPTILTAHDLSWIRYPETHPAERVAIMNRYFEPCLRRADLIITVSEFVKHELINVLGVAPERIKAIPLGVEALFHPRAIEDTRAVLSKHNLTHGQYLLSVGTLEPRKNLATTLRAFMKLSPMIRKRFPLILVGMKGWQTSALEEQIAPLVRAGEIRQMGYLPREELAIIVAGALTMIFPSIYEGFGLPSLEAMACGVPVITSNVSSLPEVVGDTGLLIEPHDVDALAGAIEQLVTAPDIRHELSQNAYARSLSFTWDNCVALTVEAYRQVSRSNGS